MSILKKVFTKNVFVIDVDMKKKNNIVKRCKFSTLVRMCIIGKDICNGGIEHKNCYEPKKKK